MKVVLFCHSLLSDWNHGNAHFLRGLVSELVARGHSVRSFEPEDAWSVTNLIADVGELPIAELRRHYPELGIERYRQGELDLEQATDGADLVLVHEWNEPQLIEALGRQRQRPGKRGVLLFHDTHHRTVSDSASIARLDLSGYDGVLAFGEAVRQQYLRAGFADRVFTFHEAADTRVFRPLPAVERTADLVWVGNFGDDERTQELHEFLLEPARAVGASGAVYGVRYPESAVAAVRAAGLEYGGWAPNFRVPELFARHRVTVHVPRRPYARELPGIPTIRVFEALACGIPLISAPWSDSEGLFRTDDFVRVESGEEMKAALKWLLSDAPAREELARRGRETILARHTCAHRVDELLKIAEVFGAETRAPARGGLRASGESSTWD